MEAKEVGGRKSACVTGHNEINQSWNHMGSNVMVATREGTSQFLLGLRRDILRNDISHDEAMFT